MNLRHLRCFAVLATEGHCGRAASRCHVTQPTLSEAIRQLEAELGVPLVERGGQRFRGLTPEGARALGRVRRILADEDALAQELTTLKQGLAGMLRFGVIPAAMVVAPLVVDAFHRHHPRVTIRLLSMSSIEIQRALDSFDLEAGLTYLENEPPRNVRMLPLYRERYVLLTPSRGRLARRATIGWREAAAQLLCLLTPEMQNRRIVDRLFREAGAAPVPAIETDSVMALCAHVRLGARSSVVPHSLLALLDRMPGVRAIPLVDPAASQSVGLVATDREPLPPLARAFLASAAKAGIAARLDALLPKRRRSSS